MALAKVAGKVTKQPARRPTSEERRRQIADAAKPIFAVNGLAGTKTRQIAEAAGVPEPVLYRHFKSKDEIFQFAILEPVERLAVDLMRLTVEFAHIDARQRLERSQQIQREIYLVVREITPLLGVALFSDRTAGQAFYQQRLRPLVELSGTALSKAMAPRQRRAMDPETLFLALLGMYVGVSLHSLFVGDDDADEVARRVTDLISFGVFGHRNL
jgi:AcrR family transcriptional regulator